MTDLEILERVGHLMQRVILLNVEPYKSMNSLEGVIEDIQKIEPDFYKVVRKQQVKEKMDLEYEALSDGPRL